MVIEAKVIFFKEEKSMKGKKLLSMLTAGALAVTMAMPAAAAESGSVEVDLTTKTGVLRVEVPTTLAIAVDQFELDKAGTQIASADFTMVNKSQMPVHVGVESTATVNGVTLKDTVAEVEEAGASDVFAWMGVAAMTAKNTYYGSKGSFADLNEASANVETFDAADSNKATQEFYLAKATGNETYKVMVPTAAGKANVSYAQFYELTDASVTDQATLDAKLKTNDVYVTTATTVEDGTELTLVKQGGSYTWATGLQVYTAATNLTAVNALAANTKYVYAEMSGTDGGAAGFRYIGKLSSGDKESWTKTDISKIKIEYTITSISPAAYAEKKADCVYGLYKPFVAAGYTGSTTDISSTNKTVTLTGLPADVTVSKVELVKAGAATLLASGNQYSVSGTGATAVVTFSKYADTWKEFKVRITYSDGKADLLGCQ